MLGNEDVFAAIVALLTPVGTLVPTLMTAEPEDGSWKLCDGRALPKTAGATVQSVETGVAVNPTGSGQAIDITSPVIGVNWLIRA